MELFNKGMLLEGIYEFIDPIVECNIGAEVCIMTHLSEAWYIQSKIQHVFDAGYNPEEGPDVKELLEDYNTALAKALGVFIGLMKDNNIMPENINEYYDILLRERNLSGIFFDDALKTSLAYGRHSNIFDDTMRIANYSSYSIYTDEDVEKDFTLGLMGRKYSIETDHHNQVDQFKFACVLRSALQGWGGDYQTLCKNLMEAWLYFTKFLDSVGAHPLNIYSTLETISKEYASHNTTKV